MALLVAIGAAVGVALYLFVPPEVVPATASATEFSAERAMEDVRVIAEEPHPMGSAEHEEVADYIGGRLEELGLSPEVQETTGLSYTRDEAAAGFPGQVHAGRVKNILARIPGTDNTGAVLLVSHYDSMPTTNAAADGGVSTATVLETVRAIQEGPPLKNDVIVYVGDADVNGLLGPEAYHKHPWSDDAEVGFAFEGIGSYGPSALVFDAQALPDPGPSLYAAPQNGRWLGEALEVLPHPFLILAFNDLPNMQAASPELIRLLVGTDAAELGFGQFRGAAAYHTILDNPERLDPRSLQHQGSNALSLTRHFGDLPLEGAEQQSAPNLVAFNALPDQVIAYPSTWALPLGLAIAALFVAILVVGIRRGHLKVGALLSGVVLILLSVVSAVVVTSLGWKFGGAINPAYQVWMGRGYYGADWRLLFLASLTLAFMTALYLLARRFIRVARDDAGVAAGSLVVLALLMILTGLGMPYLSYLFTWSTLVGVFVLGFGMLAPSRAARLWPRVITLAITAFVPIVLFTPPIYAIYSLQAAPFAGSSGLVSPVVAAFVLLALMVGALLPHLWFIGGRRRWVVPIAFATLALIFLVGELVSTRFDADNPRPDYVQYRLDADTGEVTWISDTSPPDAWTEQFFEGGYQRGEEAFAPVYFFGQEFEVIRAPAPAVELPAPTLEVLDDTTGEDTRSLRLRLTSPRSAPYAHLEMALPGDLDGAIVDGEQVEVSEIPAEQRRSFALTFYNLPDEGVEITLSVQSTESIDATLADYSNELPEIPGMEIEPRPPEFMPAPYDFRDPTVVNKSFEL